VLKLLGKYVPFLRPKPSLPRAEMLGLRPVRNPVVTWELRPPDDADEESEDLPRSALLTVPRRKDRIGRLLSGWFQMPEGKSIELDEFGANIWQMCDGSHRVEDLVKYTCTVYKLNRRQGEVSIVAFMRMLTQRRLIGFKSDIKGADNGIRQPDRASGRKRRQRAHPAHRRH
jgi:hypothetical protein